MTRADLAAHAATTLCLLAVAVVGAGLMFGWWWL